MTCQHSDKFRDCYAVDIDGTLLTQEKPNNYTSASGIAKNIDKVNRLYDSGNHITLWTSRHDNLRVFTKLQLKQWKIKYHDLIMGKPLYDLYIGDKAVNIRDWQ